MRPEMTSNSTPLHISCTKYAQEILIDQVFEKCLFWKLFFFENWFFFKLFFWKLLFWKLLFFENCFFQNSLVLTCDWSLIFLPPFQLHIQRNFKNFDLKRISRIPLSCWIVGVAPLFSKLCGMCRTRHVCSKITEWQASSCDHQHSCNKKRYTLFRTTKD